MNFKPTRLQVLIGFINTAFNVTMIVLIYLSTDSMNTCVESYHLASHAVLLHIFALINPLFIRTSTFGALLKRPNWENNIYDLFNMMVLFSLGAFGVTFTINTINTESPDSFKDSLYPIVIFYIEEAYYILNLCLFSLYMGWKTVRNLFRLGRLIFRPSYKKQQISAQVQVYAKRNIEDDLLQAIQEKMEVGQVTAKLFLENEEYLKMTKFDKKKDKLNKGFIYEEKNTPEFVSGLMHGVLKSRSVALYKSKLSVPKALYDPGTFLLLKALNKFDAKILSNSLCASIVEYYWNFVWRPQLTKNFLYCYFSFYLYTHVISQVQQPYPLLYVEIFLLIFNSFIFSYELLEMVSGPKIYFSTFEHLMDVITRLLTFWLLIGDWVGAEIGSFEHKNIASLILMFGSFKFLYSAKVVPAINQFMMFVDQAIKDLVGLVLVFVLTMIGLSLAYMPLLLDLPVGDDGTDTFGFLSVLYYVGLRVVTSFDTTPGQSSVYITVYISTLFMTILLLNSVIAVQSDTWAFTKEFQVGASNKHKVLSLISYLNLHQKQVSQTSSGDYVFLHWLGEPPPEPEDENSGPVLDAIRADIRELKALITSHLGIKAPEGNAYSFK
jgi:hypothetical protein